MIRCEYKEFYDIILDRMVCIVFPVHAIQRKSVNHDCRLGRVQFHLASIVFKSINRSTIYEYVRMRVSIYDEDVLFICLHSFRIIRSHIRSGLMDLYPIKLCFFCISFWCYCGLFFFFCSSVVGYAIAIPYIQRLRSAQWWVKRFDSVYWS